MEVFNAIFGPLWQEVVGLFGIAIGGLLAAVLTRLFQKYGLDVEAINRDALQKAITNGAIEAVRRAGGPAVATSVSFENVNAGVEQVKAGVPDAIKAFKVPEAEIAKRVEAQATAIVQSIPAPVAPNPNDLLTRVLSQGT